MIPEPSPPDRPQLGPVTASNRSRLTNGSSLHLGRVDGRSAAARRWRDLYAALMAAVGKPVTEAQRQLVRRAVTLAILAERSEAALSRGESIDTGGYIRVSGALSRVLRTLGLEPDVGDGTLGLAERTASEKTRFAMDFPEIDPSLLTDEERSTLVRLIEKATPKQHG